jgi:hypothetical protein
LFPFFAIITAVFVKDVFAQSKNLFFSITQTVIVSILVLAFIVLNFVFSPEKFVVFGLITIALVIVSWYIYKNAQTKYHALFLLTCCVAVWLNTYFVLVVYPTILRYKPEVQASTYVNQHLVDKPIIVICAIPNAFPFYIPRPIEVTSLSRLLAKPVNPNAVVLIDDNLVKEMDYLKVNYTVIKAFEDYPQESLTLPFILKSERYKTLDHFYLVTINKNK